MTMMFTPARILPFASLADQAAPLQMPALSRPALLIAAARAGQAGWRRESGLRRLLRIEEPLARDEVMALLLSQEEICDQNRRARAAEYDLSRHILLLIAILAEFRAEMAAGASAVATPVPVPIPARN